MNLPNCDGNQTQDILRLTEQLLPIWLQQAPAQMKYDKKTGLAGVALPAELRAIPFSILKDTKGQFYFIENDPAVTKSEENKGAQGKYKRLFPIEIGAAGKLSVGAQQLGVKTAKKLQPKKSAKAEEKDDLMNSIFGAKSGIPLMNDIFAPLPVHQSSTDEVGALKAMGRLIDAVQIGSKQYILMQHYDGMQLLKFINSKFADYDLKKQIEVFADIMVSCVIELGSLHAKNIAHRDAQFKNFIKSNDDNTCHVIDLGSSLQHAKRGQMENDFLTLANEMRYFDPCLNASEFKGAWAQFKEVFKIEVMKENVSARNLAGMIEAFKELCLLADSQHSVRKKY